jgi:hypothetical protein
MAVPNIFKTGSQAKVNALVNQALQLGATPTMLNTVTRGAITPNYTLPTAVTQNVPVGSEFDVDFNAPSSRYVPDQRSAREILSSSNSPFALIGKGVNAVANIPNMSLPALVPPYDPVANRQATQALIDQNTANRAIQQAAYDADKQQRIADADISQYLPNMSLPDMSLPDSAYDFGAAVRAAPADIARHLMYPFNRAAIAVENAGTDILDSDFVGGLTGREEGVTYTEARDKAKSKLSPSGTTDDTFKEGASTPTIDPSIAAAVNDPLGLGTAKIQTKLKDTSALDKSEGQGSGADNWFDAVNERVDLMAMGAAMLAGSSSGEGTLANLGKGLQAGIASKKSAAQAAEAKKYRDAALALDAIRAQAAARKARVQERAAGLIDPFKNEGAKINAIVSQLKAANIEGEPSDLNDIAALINTTDPSFVTAPQESRSKVMDFMAKDLGDNWFSSGGNIDITKTREGYIKALQSLSGTK